MLCADVVPRQKEVGERAAVPGVPQLLLALILRPRLQDARAVREGAVGGAHCFAAAQRPRGMTDKWYSAGCAQASMFCGRELTASYLHEQP